MECANVVRNTQVINDDWYCLIGIKNIPFGNMCDDDLEILLSGLTEESFRLYETFKQYLHLNQINSMLIRILIQIDISTILILIHIVNIIQMRN